MTVPDVEITPPDTDGDGDDSPGVYTSCSINGRDGGGINANLILIDPTDEDIAAALVKTALAAAQLYGSGAWIALQQRLGEVP